MECVAAGVFFIYFLLWIDFSSVYMLWNLFILAVYECVCSVWVLPCQQLLTFIMCMLVALLVSWMKTIWFYMDTLVIAKIQTLNLWLQDIQLNFLTADAGRQRQTTKPFLVFITNHWLISHLFTFSRPQRTNQVTWTWVACQRPQLILRRTMMRRTSSERRTPSWAGTSCGTVWRRTPWTELTMT